MEPKYINPEIDDFELDKSSINDKTSEGMIIAANQSRGENYNRLSNSRLSHSILNRQRNGNSHLNQYSNIDQRSNASQNVSRIEYRRRNSTQNLNGNTEFLDNNARNLSVCNSARPKITYTCRI